MSLSKQLYEEIEQLEARALSGEINEIQALIELKEYESFISQKKDSITKSAMRLVELENGETTQFGYTVSMLQKSTWKYDHIKTWADKKNELAQIEEKAKAAFKLNQSFDKSGVESFEDGFLNMGTGEVIEAAVCEYSKPFLKIEKEKAK